MKILPDYEHMEYRDVYTCRTYPRPALWLRYRCMGDYRLTSCPREDANPRSFLLCSAAAVVCGLLWWVKLRSSLGSVCRGWDPVVA